MVLNANERATAYTGYSLRQLVGMHMRDLGTERVRDLYEDRRDEVLSDGSTVFDVRILRKDGTRMPVEVTSRLTRIWGEDLVISSLRDMTERKKAEKETKRRAEQLAFLNEILLAATKSLDIDVVLGAVLDAAITVSGAPSGILVLEEPPGSEQLRVAKARGVSDGLISGMSQAGLQRLGALASRSRGATVVGRQRMVDTGTGSDRIEAMRQEGIEELLVISLKSGAKFLGAVTMGAPAGFFSEDDCDFYSTVGAETGVCIENALIYHELTAEHERLSLLYRSAQNISSQLELGTLLKTTAEEAARAVGAESALIGLVDPGLGDFAWGAAHNVDLDALKNVRLPVGEGVGGHIMKTKRAHRWTRDAYPEDPVVLALDIHSGVALPLISGDMVLGVLEVHCTADRRLDVSEEDIQLLEAMGRQAGVAIENARLYEETRGHMAALQKANAELLSLDRMKSDFVSTVSHELRSPLAVIEGFAKTLVEHFDRIDRDTERESIEIILKKAIALEGLIENILDMSRIEEGRLEVIPRRFDILELVEKVRSDQEIVSESGRVEVRTTHETLFVLADPEKTEVVLSNLVGNAIKFSPDGGTVVIAPNKFDGVVRVSVTDEGIGIPAMEQERIFDRFYQVDRGETRSFQGAGLGLYITRELLETMGGRIIVESRVGFGSTFTFTLPMA
jgi:PAS domain S-box-containing protein